MLKTMGSKESIYKKNDKKDEKKEKSIYKNLKSEKEKYNKECMEKN